MASFFDSKIGSWVFFLGFLLMLGLFVSGIYDVVNTNVVFLFVVMLVPDIVIFTLSSVGIPIEEEYFAYIFAVLVMIYSVYFLGFGPGIAAGLIGGFVVLSSGLPLIAVTTLVFRFLVALIVGYVGL